MPWKATYKADQLGVALRELGLELGKGAQLGGAGRGEVVGVREEDAVSVANVLVEVDLALCGDGLEVGGVGAETEAESSVRWQCN